MTFPFFNFCVFIALHSLFNYILSAHKSVTFNLMQYHFPNCCHILMPLLFIAVSLAVKYI